MKYIIIFLFAYQSILGQTVSTLVPFNVGDDLHYAVNKYIYSSHYGGLYLRKINPFTGQVDTILNADNNTVGAIEVDSALNIYVCSYDFGWLGKFQEGNTNIQIINTGFSGPAGITQDGQGNLYIATNQNHSIIKILPDGCKEIFFQGNPLFWPTGITSDPSGNIYVANMFSGQIIKITPDKETTTLAVLPAVLDQVPDLAYLCWVNDMLYVCHIGNHVIYQINAENGEASIIAGTGIAGMEDGPALSASFENPTGIVANLSGDTLYITDGAAPNQRLRMLVLNSTTSIKNRSGSIFSNIKLTPNPTQNFVTITFELDQSLSLSAQITDTSGIVQWLQPDKKFLRGIHEIKVDVRNFPVGQYILILKHKEFSKTISFIKN